MNVNYYLKNKDRENSPINAVVRFMGQLYRFFPGITIQTEFWDPSEQLAQEKKPYKKEAQIINIQLKRFAGYIEKAFEPYIINQTPPDLETIRQEVNALKNDQETTHNDETPVYFTDFFKQYYENANYKPQTRKNYNSTFNILMAFETEMNQRLRFEDIDLLFYDRFKTWLLNRTYSPGTDSQGQPLPARKYSINYFGSQIKNIKSVMNEAGPKGAFKLHGNREIENKRFKVEAETADTVYLTVDELLKIHRFTPDLNNIAPLVKTTDSELRRRKVEALNLVKNKFLIGCFTALRVSDFNRLDEVNIRTGFISIRPAKGTRKNENVIIPIHPVIREILQSGFNLAAPVSDQKINEHIKEVCQLVGINEPVITARTEGGKIIEKTQPKYELITNHTARRSGASNMYLAGIPAISIMRLTGHKTQNSFMKYIKISQEENARLLAEHPFFK